MASETIVNNADIRAGHSESGSAQVSDSPAGAVELTDAELQAAEGGRSANGSCGCAPGDLMCAMQCSAGG